MSGSLPLNDVTVIALEQAIAAPFATRQLADLGARVIKIERVGLGDFARNYDQSVKGMASHFVWLNRTKESLTLDLKRPPAQEVLGKLVERADVFVHNLAPGAVDRLGFDRASLAQKYPRLIVCQISGFGSDGPYRDKKAYDLLVQAETGLLSITGTEASPAKVGISVADIAAGMYAFSGILTALLSREKTGDGAFLDVSLFEALGEWMGYPMYYTNYGGEAPSRAGTRHATIAPYGDVATGDGLPVFIAIQNEREWKRFCESVLESPELASDPRFQSNHARMENQDVLFEVIENVFQSLSSSEVVERLVEANIAHAEMNEVLDFVRHPQLAARDRWREVDSPAGKISALLPPGLPSGVEPMLGKVPAIGEHTESILKELGFDQVAVEALRSDGVI